MRVQVVVGRQDRNEKKAPGGTAAQNIDKGSQLWLEVFKRQHVEWASEV